MAEIHQSDDVNFDLQRTFAERKLMQAAIAADALFHRLKDKKLLAEGDQIVCDQLVDAISDGMRLGF